MVTRGLSPVRCGDSRFINQAQLRDGRGEAGDDEEDVEDVQDCILKSRKRDDGDNHIKERH